MRDVIGIVVAIIGYGSIICLIMYNYRLRKGIIRELVKDIKSRGRTYHLVDDTKT
jgi:hypothetical protein